MLSQNCHNYKKFKARLLKENLCRLIKLMDQKGNIRTHMQSYRWEMQNSTVSFTERRVLAKLALSYCMPQRLCKL